MRKYKHNLQTAVVRYALMLAFGDHREYIKLYRLDCKEMLYGT